MSDVFPPLPDNRNRSYYRRRVTERFLESRGSQPKRADNGKQYRTEPQSRLDRALTETAQAYDRSEANIRALCIHDVYTGEDQTGQFLDHLLEIEQMVG
jgi:light-regulated signal transduction histidine kinase (bacteriophytochrome)